VRVLSSTPYRESKGVIEGRRKEEREREGGGREKERN
jgi:hypothetical protein